MIYQQLNTRLLRSIQRAIRLYQCTLSPDHGLLRFLFPSGVCRYHPTCSTYMSQAIYYHGWAGLLLGIKRILRCHPFAKGGEDPLRHKTETRPAISRMTGTTSRLSA